MTTTAPRTPSPSGGLRRWTAVLLVFCLCTISLTPFVVAPASGEAPETPATPSLADATGPTAWQVATPSNESNETNRSIRHRDPRGLSEDGDLSELERSLANRLASSLNESSVAIDQGQYDRARSILGDRYDTVLERYVRVTRETPERRDDTRQFHSTRNEQSAFVETVSTYRERRVEYDRAKRAGDEGRARELARELNELAVEAEERNERLSREYDGLGDESGRDFSVAKQSLSNVQRNISAEQAVIREAEFVETALDVTGVGGGGSFVDPVRISGRLVDETGVPLANQSVRIAINDTEVETETDADAVFSVAYRPVTDGLGEQSLTVEYVPRTDSVYLGSRATATAVIAQSTPTLTIDDSSTRARFGDRVVVSGSVAVSDRPAAGVPLNVSVGDVFVGKATSDDVGDFRFEGSLPASVDSGAQQLWVAYPFEGRALAPNRTSTPFAVGSTRTRLSVDGKQAALESLAVAGRLRTSDGRPVAGQQVTVYVAGQESAVAETTTTGLFATNVWLPSSTVGRSAADVVVVFDGTGTNLVSSRANTRVPIVGAGAKRGGVGGGGGGGSDGTGGSGGTDGERDERDSTGGGVAGTAGGGSDDAASLVGDAAGPVGRVLLGIAGPLAAVEFYGISVRGLAASLWFDVVVVLVGIFGSAGIFAVVVRARRRTASGAAGDDDASDPTASPVAGAGETDLPTLLLDLARDRVETGETRLGVEYAYLGARIGVATRFGISNSGTHRQFAAAVALLAEADNEGFGTLTERYEQAIFGSRTPSVEDAYVALAEARQLVAEADPVTGSGADTTSTRDDEWDALSSHGTRSPGD